MKICLFVNPLLLSNNTLISAIDASEINYFFHAFVISNISKYVKHKRHDNKREFINFLYEYPDYITRD